MASPIPQINSLDPGLINQITSVPSIDTWTPFLLEGIIGNESKKIRVINYNTEDLIYGLRVLSNLGSPYEREMIIAYDAILPGSNTRNAGGVIENLCRNTINFSKSMNSNVNSISDSIGSNNWIQYANGSSNVIEYNIELYLTSADRIDIYTKSLDKFIVTLNIDKTEITGKPVISVPVPKPKIT